MNFEFGDDQNLIPGDGCDASCQWETDCAMDNPHPTMSCGEQKSGSFAGLFGDSENACGQSFPWQDQIYVLQWPDDGMVEVTYSVGGADPNDGAIFILAGSCHSELCVASSLDEGDRHHVAFEASSALDYHIVLEAPSQQPSFTLSVNCLGE